MHVIPGGTNLVAILVPGGLIRGGGGQIRHDKPIYVLPAGNVQVSASVHVYVRNTY